MVSYEEIEIAALNQPRAERERLVIELIRSLDDDPPGVDRDLIVAAWMEEADERWRRYRSGEMEAVPAAGVIVEARRRLTRKPDPPS